MNLWAKSLKQLALWSVALFFFSCQDETTFIGLKNPNPKFEVFSVEIPLTSSVITVDSIYTDNTAGAPLLMGGYTDPVLGRVDTKSFLHIWPTAAAKIAATSVFDSVTIQLRYNYYNYGAATNRAESFKIYEVSDQRFATAAPLRATAASTLNYLSTPLASAATPIDKEDFEEQFALPSTQQDTLLVTKRMTGDLGLRIFDLAKKYAFNATNRDTLERYRLAFFQAVNGLALVPDETTQGVVAVRNDAFSFLTVHYHSMEAGAVKDTLSRNFSFSGASFSQISNDRTGSELSTVTRSYYPHLEDPTGLRYLQSGNPILTRVDLENYYKFLEEDTVKDILINEVRFVIDGIQSTTATPPHSALALKLVNRNGYFFNYAVTGERNELLLNNRFIFPSISTPDVNYNHFFVSSEFSNSPAVLGYQSDENRYEGYITTFMQGLIRNRTLSTGEKNQKRIQYLALYPINPSFPFSVTRTIFPADQVKLKIYFTRPVSTSNP